MSVTHYQTRPDFGGPLHIRKRVVDSAMYIRTAEDIVQPRKQDSLKQLSDDIAHDLNNLLTVIVGNADLLIENLQDRPELRRFCNAIVASGERGAILTNRLMAFSHHGIKGTS